MDMGGNVSEWTASETKPRPPPTRKPTGSPKSAARYKIICGASWAGLEADRAERVVPAKIIERTTDPEKSVLVDHPLVWGIEARSLSEVDFAFHAVVKGIPFIRIRKWVPRIGDYVSASFRTQEGAYIGGRREVQIGSGPEAMKISVDFTTGCRLMSVSSAHNPLRACITYADVYGKKHEMHLAGLPAIPAPEPAPPPSEETETPSAEEILRQISNRSLADVARSSNNMAAPHDARFINCGFRCVKDL